MEDFIKFLIWAVIIISFFSSFFKKGKGKKTPSPPQRRPDNQNRNRVEQFPSSTETNSNSSASDVFKEIERLFKGEVTPTVEAPTPVERTTTKSQTAIEKSQYESSLKKEKSFNHYRDEWHKEVPGEHNETASEHVLETNWEREKKKLADARKRVTSKVDEEAKRFEKF